MLNCDVLTDLSRLDGVSARALAGNAMKREAGKRALVLVARHHDLVVTLDSLPAAVDMPRRRTPRGTSGPPRELSP